jgi:hypothetical protein
MPLTRVIPQLITSYANGQVSVVASGLAINPDNLSGVGAYKILGQIATTANAVANVYVVPSTSTAMITSVTICNGTQSDVQVDLAARLTSEALAAKHYIIKSLVIPAADTLILEPGITLPANSILVANTVGANAASCAAGIAVHAYGVQIQ